jgi:hypothetical protein
MAKYKYIGSFPKPFLADLAAGRVLPFIGAGFSKNAEIPKDSKMLEWDELGEAFASDIQGYKYKNNAIDAISAYAHEYSRTSLIEKLSKLLLINTVKPGKTHRAFCELQFDIVCTTNFEFLLEAAYAAIAKFCQPIIDEEQLSISGIKAGVSLLKLHGDLHHPKRLVATEEDYDKFLSNYPMLATFLANLLITRTAFFIGYSVDDTDFRQVWQLIKDRLGDLRRKAYTIKVNCSSQEKLRYERRGVRVIDIPGNPAEYSTILEDVFVELRDYWNTEALKEPIVSEDDTLAELSLPEGANNRLCFFSVPFNQLSYYKKYIYPEFQKNGLKPISADEIITSKNNWIAKVSALISKSEFFIVDLSSSNTIFELGLAINSKKSSDKILIINDENLLIPSSFNGMPFITRPSNPFDNPDLLVEQVNAWLRRTMEPLKAQYQDEPKRLMSKKEYRAAVISAITLLENHIRNQFENIELNIPKSVISGNLFNLAANHKILEAENLPNIKKWTTTRNYVVHSDLKVSAAEAAEVVNGVYAIIDGPPKP